MNTNNFKILENLSQIICSANNESTIIEGFKNSIRHIKNVRMFFYDYNYQRLKDVNNNFAIVDELYDEKKVHSIYSNFYRLSKCDFIIDKSEVLKSSYSNDEDILFSSISTPLMVQDIVVGMLEIEFEKTVIFNSSFFGVLKIISAQILLWIQNQILSVKLQTNSDFYDTLKNIAKIIETQYELNYIIPLIGEMIDKFVQNHLIYIFIKQNNEFKLFWPNACRDKQVVELISKLKNENYVLSENKKIGIFPLYSNKETLGCIVAHSMIDKLTTREIDFITQLTRQSSITIERANTYAEILRHATLDALTGLNNRRQFEVRLKQEYELAIRQKSNLCAIMLDIDFFKSINDTHGHAIGDKVLKTMANIIKKQLREYDIASRYGGEEFCILLPQTKIEEASIVAQRLRAAVESTQINIDEDKNINITISIGLSQLREKDKAEDLYKRADKALYDAKNRGRNRVVVDYE